MNDLLRQFIEKLQREKPAEPEFLQTVSEIGRILVPYIDEHPFRNNKIFLAA